MANLSLASYLIANSIFFGDLIDLVCRVYLRRVPTSMGRRRSRTTSVALDIGEFTPYQMRLHLRPFAMLVSVHNAAAELDRFLEVMRPYHHQLWMVDDCSTDDTWERLRRSGVRSVRSHFNRKKPGAIKHLLEFLPAEITTVMVLDPDVRILNHNHEGISDLERVLFEFQRSGMAALCPRIVPRPDGYLVTLQSLEFYLACTLGRNSLADRSITSGVAIYRRDALGRALSEHNLCVYAEDLRNTLILLRQGERIYYDGRLVVETEGKRYWRQLFSQRVGWFFGFIKVYVEHFRDVAQCTDRRPLFIYQYLVYMGVFALLFHPLKIAGLLILVLSLGKGVDNLFGLGLVPDVSAANPWYFPLAYFKYTVLAFVAIQLAAEPGERKRLLRAVPAYFFYAVLHTIPVTVGYLNWFSARWWGRRVYRDHYD